MPRCDGRDRWRVKLREPDAVVLACLHDRRKVRLTQLTVDHETGLIRGLERDGRPATLALEDVGHLHLIRDGSARRTFDYPSLRARRAHDHEEAPRAHP